MMAADTMAARVARTVTMVFGALAVTALVGLGAGATPAHAATQAGYPTALVEYAASTRTLPYVAANTYSGYALKEQGSDGRQTVSVLCWFDGDWATGT